MNLDNIVEGANEYALEISNLPKDECLVGKTPPDLYPCSLADKIVKRNKQVLQKGKILVQEESMRAFESKIWCFFAVKSPITDEEGNIIGLLGTSVDLFSSKEKLFRDLKKISDLYHSCLLGGSR
jgi:PAS domain-containing protein